MNGLEFFDILMREPTRTVNHPPKHVLHELASGDLRNGVPTKEVKRVLKELEGEEHYEACQGIKDALDEHNASVDLTRNR